MKRMFLCTGILSQGLRTADACNLNTLGTLATSEENLLGMATATQQKVSLENVPSRRLQTPSTIRAW